MRPDRPGRPRQSRPAGHPAGWPARWLVGLVAGLAMVAVAGVAGCDAGGARSVGGIQIYPTSAREPAPDLSGPTLADGSQFRLADHRGEVIVINFWASWCGPCRAEADDLEQTYQATRAAGVSFLGIATNDQRDKAEAFLRGRFSYPSLFDPSGQLAMGFAVPPTAIPSTLVIDRAGRIAAVIRTAVLRSQLEPVVAQLSSEPEPASAPVDTPAAALPAAALPAAALLGTAMPAGATSAAEGGSSG